MENRKCPVLVGSKACGLALSLVAREIESATEVYECPLGHRTEVPFGELVEKKMLRSSEWQGMWACAQCGRAGTRNRHGNLRVPTWSSHLGAAQTEALDDSS